MSKRVRRTPPPNWPPTPPASPQEPPQQQSPATQRAEVQDVRRGELGALSAHFVSSLPAAVTMLCRTGPSRLPFVVTTSRQDWEAARGRTVAVFAGDEWAAMVVAAQQDRAAPLALEEWVRVKRGDGLWSLTPQLALGGFIHMEPPPRTPLTVAQVLKLYGAELRVVPATVPATDADWADAYAAGGAP